MKSIRRRLTVGVTTALLAALCAGGAAVYWAARDAHYDQFDSALRTKALVVITATDYRNDRVRVDFSDRFLREFDDGVATSFFQVWDEDGRRIERSDSLEKQELPQRSGSLEEPDYWNLELPNGQPGRAVGIAFRVRAGGAPRHAVVVVATVRDDLDRLLDRLLVILLAVGGAVLLVVVLTIPFVMSRGLRPLQQVTDWAAGMNARRLTERIPAEGLPAELQPIATRLNELLSRLGVSFERERRFSSNLAHELLTPVAEVRTLAETALKWPETAGPEAHRHQLSAALRMEGLITRLLELLRAEDDRLAVANTSIDLGALANETWRPFAEVAAEKRLAVEIAVPAGLTVVSDPVLLRSVLHNLLANAVQYSPPGGRVRLTANEHAGFVEIALTNPAPALTREDLPNLFERLWRKDEARSDGTNHGLGLSLSREFARTLGWDLSAELFNDGELTMTLSGPVHPVVGRPAPGKGGLP